MRLEHVCHAIDKNEWPSPRQIYMSYATTATTNTVAQQSSAMSSRSPTPSLTRSSTPQQDHRQHPTPTTSASVIADQHYRALLDPLKHHDIYGLSAMAQLDQYAMVSIIMDSRIICFRKFDTVTGQFVTGSMPQLQLVTGIV